MEMMYKRFLETEKTGPNGELIDFKWKKLESFNFAYDVVDVIAKETPDKRALLWVNDKGEKRNITFSELSEKSDALAAFLMSKGIKKGDKIMLVMKRHYEYWYSYLALHKIGAVGIPATSQLLAKDYIYRFELADVAGIIATGDGQVAEYIDEAESHYHPILKILNKTKRTGWYNFQSAIDSAPKFIKPAPDELPKPDDTMLLYFTSGTTGMPKMVMHDFMYPLGLTPMALYWHKVVPGGLHITVAETGWAKAAWGKMYGAWMADCAFFVYDHDRFHAADLLDVITKYKVTTFCAPPTIYRFMIQEDLTKYDFSHLTHASIAGEALNPEVFNRFYKATGLKPMEGYGQTELVLVASTLFYMEPKPGSMGKAVPYLPLDIVDDDGNTVDNGVNGEIVLRCTPSDKQYGIFKGYYKDEEMTNSVWQNGMYHTGDIAWRDEDGYLWFVSRKDDVIKSSGYRIGPFEVESVLMEHPAVVECAVTGAPDPVRGQVVKATVVLAKGYEPTEELKKDIQNYVKTHTAPYKYPRIVDFVDSLPKTISSKIRRVEIRESDKAKSYSD